ncbi:hypothetical protein [Sedimenticola sp.]|uniref:hypothetical protein n=1 Tax=Sedimenticola sp. TaxID=1940285 RepID=UPI003D10F6C9
MSVDEPISLHVSVHQIEQFCSELCQGSANTSRKHAALIALEGFITRHATTDKYTDTYSRIITAIQQYAEQTRLELLNEYADQLEPALLNKEPRELARIHRSVSRNGFDQLLEQVITRFTPEQQNALKQWANDWSDHAEKQARLAGGYPDALNFKAANISLEEYRAITELKRRLTPL